MNTGLLMDGWVAVGRANPLLNGPALPSAAELAGKLIAEIKVPGNVFAVHGDAFATLGKNADGAVQRWATPDIALDHAFDAPAAAVQTRKGYELIQLEQLVGEAWRTPDLSEMTHARLSSAAGDVRAIGQGEHRVYFGDAPYVEPRVDRPAQTGASRGFTWDAD